MNNWVTAYSDTLCLLASGKDLAKLVRELGERGHRFSAEHDPSFLELRAQITGKVLLMVLPQDCERHPQQAVPYVHLLQQLVNDRIKFQALSICPTPHPDLRRTLFKAGVSDVLLAPYVTQELYWRIDRLHQEVRDRTQLGDWYVDFETGLVTQTQTQVSFRLTTAEKRVLASLVQARGHVVTRADLVYAMRASNPEGRSLNTIILRLRRKFSDLGRQPKLILTVPKRGYRLGALV